MSVLYPAGVALNLSGLDNWANAEPVTPSISQVTADAGTFWDAALDDHNVSDTFGEKVNKQKNPSMVVDGIVI